MSKGPRPNLIEPTERGLYCAAGDFYIDPYAVEGGVNRAVITHAHADHLRPGHRRYLCSGEGVEVVRQRAGPDARIEGLPYGEAMGINGVTVSFHPAGHLLGSAQVRVEHRGEVWVVTGDYKTRPDPTCAPFEVVPCHTFITESTFGLPIYRWRPDAEVFAELNAWWRKNAEEGRASIVFAYALGKAQRVLAGLDPGIGPIVAHGAVRRFVEVYAAAGIAMPEVLPGTAEVAKRVKGGALVVAPPSADGTPWLRKFGPQSRAFASGWMQVRGKRRWRSLDRGFVVSDHVDWPALLGTIDATGAERVGVTHGYTEQVVRYLRERGKDAYVVPTRFEGEGGAEDAADAAEASDAPGEPSGASGAAEGGDGA